LLHFGIQPSPFGRVRIFCSSRPMTTIFSLSWASLPHLLIAAVARVPAFSAGHDTFFSLLAGNSVDPHSDKTAKQVLPIESLGGEFICWLGKRAFFAKNRDLASKWAIRRGSGSIPVVQVVEVFSEGSLVGRELLTQQCFRPILYDSKPSDCVFFVASTWITGV